MSLLTVEDQLIEVRQHIGVAENQLAQNEKAVRDFSAHLAKLRASESELLKLTAEAGANPS